MEHPDDLDEERRAELRALLERTEWPLPCDYPWASEPDTLGRTGKPLKRKPPAKKCSRACRQFTPPGELDITTVEPFTDEDIREIEQDVLGVFLSSTPFDRIPDEDKDNFLTGMELQVAPAGKYYIAAYITGVRKQRDGRGREMAFLACATERGPVSVTVFNDAFIKYEDLLTKGRLTYMQVNKNARGQTLDVLVDLDG